MSQKDKVTPSNGQTWYFRTHYPLETLGEDLDNFFVLLPVVVSEAKNKTVIYKAAGASYTVDLGWFKANHIRSKAKAIKALKDYNWRRQTLTALGV